MNGFSSFTGFTCFLILVFAAASVPQRGNAQETTTAPSVTVSEVKQNEVVARVPVSGTLVARDEVLVYPRVSGFSIETLHFDIGDHVQAGDVLAELNRQTLAAQLAQAEAEFARAQASVRQATSQISSAEASLTQANTVLDRAERLRRSGAGTQADLDQAITSAQAARAGLASAKDGLGVAEAQQQQAQAQLDIAKINLEHATIVAPVDGLISARSGQIGSIAASGGEPIFRLVANGTIEVEAEVVETALSDIKSGDQVFLDIAGIGDVTGTVRLISPTVDPVNRLGLIRISTEANPNLRAGLFAGGWVITERRTSMTVPATAVLTDADGNYVLLANKDGLVERRPITAGLVWENRREVVAGLALGDVVVAKAGAFFADGDLINPINSDIATTAEVTK